MMFARLREWLIRKLGGVTSRDLRALLMKMEREEQKARLRAFERALDIHGRDLQNDPLGSMSMRNLAQQYQPKSEEVAAMLNMAQQYKPDSEEVA